VGELVEHAEHPALATIVGAILDEVIGPDMIALLRPQPDAWAADAGPSVPHVARYARPHAIDGDIAKDKSRNARIA
jgi:hypothetical protein